MRHFGNPVHYLNDRELQAMAANEGVTVAALLKKYKGHIMPSADRPRGSRSQAAPAFVSAGRRAAASGVGLRITRKNTGWDPTMYEIEPGIVYEPNVGPPPEFVSNPFSKVTEPGPGKIQVTSKRGKTLYMTQNQVAKMGDKMLKPGEVQRVLGRSNPRTFRGVKQAMSPAEKAHARRMRKHSGSPLEHNLVHSNDPEAMLVGDHIERGISRREKKAAGTYGSVNDEVPGQYDEAEFQKHMANLGLKSNPRRR